MRKRENPSKLTIGIKDSRNSDRRPNLVVNGQCDPDSFVFEGQNGEHAYAHVYDTSVANILLSTSLGEIERHFRCLVIPCAVDWIPYFDSIEIDFRTFSEKKFASIDIEMRPDWERWAKPYSMVEYAEVIERVIKQRRKRGFYFLQEDELISNGFGLRHRLSSLDVKTQDKIDYCVKEMKEICDAAEKLLAATARRNSVTTFFNFPPAVRTACEQYLLYFVQFLDDLGVKAVAEIKEDVHRVLFSVTPADGPTALAQVREALDLYLQLPGMPETATATLSNPNVAIQQLQANIFHLKSQIMLAHATLTVKDATIEALQLSNFQYRQLIESSQDKQGDKEALIGDSVHVTKVETTGLSVDLPLMLRKLKRRLGWG